MMNMSCAMKILAIDTATEACSVALSTADDVIQKYMLSAAGQPPVHSKLILQMVDEVLQESCCSLNNLDAIAVNTGPGSFTGVRIGLGVTQGLAYAANIAVIEVCSLEALAATVEHGMVFPAIDARMNQIYCAWYEVPKNANPIQRHLPIVVAPTAVPFRITKPVHGLGSGWDMYSETLKSTIEHGITHLPNRYPEAKYVAKVARQRTNKLALSPLQLRATYVRNNIC